MKYVVYAEISPRSNSPVSEWKREFVMETRSQYEANLAAADTEKVLSLKYDGSRVAVYVDKVNA